MQQRPYTPQTKGMVECFNGRVGFEVLGIIVYSHRALEQLLRALTPPTTTDASAC